ncbi:hypothetical protein H8F21_15835 [Pseudomonas sp. P66]|uniref:DUF7688 domain-containing protein n=1 Tax=Pseudomonas arcuscaelestis TaxID=2710591 RepID=A0ABS2BZM3_9PSED|nr:hypothetical protein [Pseudomonas arcuscaelestis]MBM5459039.1 hypothetical protein [Pseudomonas arcuscaelestis]
MANSNGNPSFTHTIKLNGKILFHADEESIRAIFTNLSGVDFKVTQFFTWKSHDDYLVTMGEMLEVKFTPGSVMALHQCSDDAQLAEHKF